MDGVQSGFFWGFAHNVNAHICKVMHYFHSLPFLFHVRHPLQTWLLRQRICLLSGEVFTLLLWAVSTSSLSSVTDHQGSGGLWAGCLTAHPQSDRSVQLGWTPCLRWVTGGALVHLTQFRVIWVRSGQRLGSRGTQGSVETSHGSREPCFPCACKTRVGIMRLGLKKWNDCLPFIKAFFWCLCLWKNHFALLARGSTSTAAIVHACKIAYFMRVEVFFLSEIFKIKHVFLTFLSTEPSPPTRPVPSLSVNVIV